MANLIARNGFSSKKRNGLGATMVASESGTVAYNSNGQYYNPQTGAIYGSTPPAGAWPVTMDPNYSTWLATQLGTPGSTASQTTPVQGNTTTPSTTGGTQANTSTSAGAATYVGNGSPSAPQVGDEYVNPDGSINAVYTSTGWVSGGGVANAAANTTTALTPITSAPVQSSTTATAGGNAPVASSTTVNTGSMANLFSDPIDWISQNPILAVGGAVLIVFALMNMDGKAHR